MLEFLALQAELDRDDLEPDAKRAIIRTIDDIDRLGNLSPLEQIRFRLVRARVMQALAAGYPSGPGHRAGSVEVRP